MSKRTTSKIKGHPVPIGINSSIVFLHYLFKILPVFVGALAIWLGYRLFILGVTGQASLDIQSKTVKAQLLNAAPGLFFALGGIVIVIISVWTGVRMKYAKPDEEIKIEKCEAISGP